ncbi:MAG TPA: DUF1444 family protein [Lysobacter sp.]|nr:DUF1444 family protein [Lysobacter sp.]
MAQRLRRHAPATTVGVADTLELTVAAGDLVQRVRLEQAYSDYRSAPDANRDAVLEQHARAVLQALEDVPLQPAQVIPLVKDARWLAELHARLGADAAGVHEPLADGLVVVYAQDTPTHMNYLTRRQFERLQIAHEQLRRLAVRNLRRLLPRLEVRRGPQLGLIRADGNYEASLLLFDDLWERERERLHGEPALAIPNRDVLLFADSADTDAVAHLRQAALDLHRDGAHALTDRLFVWRRSGLQPLPA